MLVFYGSTQENLLVARVLSERINLGHSLMWKDIFEPSDQFLDTLLKTADQADFAVFVMSPDDELRERELTYLAPRDNLIFEAGLFMKALGPQSVFLVYPCLGAPHGTSSSADSKTIKYLSDLSGITRMECGFIPRDADANTIVNALSTVPDRIREYLNVRQKAKSDQKWIDNAIPIYADFGIPDWHLTFRDLLQTKTMETKIFYYGPGLAKYWEKLDQAPVYLNKDILFRSILPDLLENTAPMTWAGRGVTVVDLGIGTGRPAKSVMSWLLRHVPIYKRLSYIGLDISFEMLVMARQDKSMQDILQSIKGRGEVLGFCGDFYQLSRVMELVPNGDGKLFLLLGNTLGNERNEAELLDSIYRKMRQGDLLMLDCQEVYDEDSYPQEEETPSTDNTFYCAISMIWPEAE